LEKTNLFNEYKVKDVQKDVQTRELIIREKDKIIDSLLPLQQKNEQLIERIKALEEKLFVQVRLKQVLEERIQKQVDELGKVHQKRIEDARTASMNTINEHIQLLQNLFQKSNLNEECLAAFVTSTDAIRTAVGINLI
jgi:cell division septum initiation protein DivIVA